MTRRLMWPALKGGVLGPSGWLLYDGTSGACTAVSLDDLHQVENELRATGATEMADSFSQQWARLARVAEAWNSATHPSVAA